MDGSFRDHFGPFDGRVWLNTAHQGALPRRAAAAAAEAIAAKRRPYLIRDESFLELPLRLKRALGRLVGAPAEQIVLGNSNSYGLHLIANGFPWRAGDEVLLVAGDFPSTRLPWHGLAERGVAVRELEAGTLTAERLAAGLSSATRLFCTTWVHSFTGAAVDLEELGAVCREHGVTFVVNASQALGARPIAVGELSVDAVTAVGFKWLCGPYGTGFCWLTPELAGRLRINRRYWQILYGGAGGLARGDPPADPESLGAARFDLFGTANFFNFAAWVEAVELLLELGIERIEAHDQRLVDRLLSGLGNRYRLSSPADGPQRSTLVYLARGNADESAALYRRLRERGIYGALRGGRLRLAPHLYNTEADIDAALEALAEG